MAYNTFTLTGTYTKFGVEPAQGRIEIIPSVPVVVDAEGNKILVGRVKVDALDETGSFSIDLPHPGDTGLNPTAFGYTVVAKLNHAHPPAVSFGPDQIVAGAVDVADVTPVDPSTFDPEATYAPLASVDALGERVTVLETTPAVTSYLDLTDKPTIPATAEDVGALPADAPVPEAVLPARLSEASLSAKIATEVGEFTVPKWEPNVAYDIGDIVVTPEGAIVERATIGVVTDATYSPIGWKTATGLAQAIAGSEAPRFGPLTMPAGFPTLPCTFYRDNDGVIRHNFNFGAYYPATATKVYVATTGNDTTGDGTSGLPYRTLQKAMTVVAAGAATHYEVVITDVAMFDRDQAGYSGMLTGKTVAIRSQVAARTLITTNSTYSWTADGAGTYKTTRGGVTSVLDAGNRDHHGLPVALKLVASVAACQATAGTYYTDGASVWVHRLDGALPTHDSTVVTIGTSAFSPTLAGGARLYVEGIIFCGWSNGDGLRVTGGATSTTETVVARDCGFVGTSGNGYMTNQVAKTYMFDCQSAYQQRDGFNYTFFGMTWAHARANTLVVEYGCTAYKVGLVDPGAGSNNTSTCHDGGNVLRINHVGYENTGACIIDVGGCFSVLYDCHARSPILPTGGSGQTAAFLLSANSSAQAGVAYLYDCSAADCDVALNIGTNTTAHVARFRTTETILGGGTIVYV